MQALLARPVRDVLCNAMDVRHLAVRTGEPRLTRLGTVIGTPGYLPPEALAGALPAPAADLFAAGQVAAALLRGAEPSDAGDEPRLGESDNPSSFNPRQILFAHAALSDPKRGRLLHDQRAARAGFSLAHAETERTGDVN